MRIRYTVVKEGQAMAWFEKPQNQVIQIARKHFDCTFALWNWLKRNKKVYLAQQTLANGFWQHTGSKFLT